jgi:hypothetical protein
MWRGRVICAVLALTGCQRNRRPTDDRPEVAIIYSADLRGALAAPRGDAGGLARRATWVDRARLAARALVQVDAGDIAPSAEDETALADPAAQEARARLALRAYRRMGVDAITVGERDLALGVAKWRSWCDDAKVPVVAANLVGDDGRALFPADRIVRAADVSVGVFGILDLTGEPWTAPPGVVVADPSAAARAAVRSLRARGARVIVGLFHVAAGLTRARQIAEATDGIDVVVLGHGGPSAPPRYVTADVRGRAVGRIDLRVAGGGAPRLEDHLLASTPDVSEQAGVALLLRVDAGAIPATFAESVAALSKAKGHRTFGEDWTYGSTPLCVGCHPAQAAQWRTTDHAHAYATLEHAGKSHDPSCMGCHVTGFLRPGGAQNFETATQFADVGCEACHGPSVAHVVSMDKRQGTSRKVDPTVCLGCHTPDQNLGSFDVAAAMKEIVGPGHGLPPSGHAP